MTTQDDIDLFYEQVREQIDRMAADQAQWIDSFARKHRIVVAGNEVLDKHAWDLPSH